MILLTNANAKRIPLADNSVNCVVTSPPYYGLRDYGTAEWVGGDAECEHINGTLQSSKSTLHPGTAHNDKRNFDGMPYHDVCKKCGATRIDKQIGLEQSPDDYVEAMCQVFDEIWRVLRDDGTVWLNLGDSYNSRDAGANPGGFQGELMRKDENRNKAHPRNTNKGSIDGLKPKDLIGIPWRVAFALQARGWYLRQDIIWHKPNPMPESVKDRCTKAHEYIFLLTKSARYWYDNTAIYEPANYDGRNDTVFKGSLKYDSDTLSRVGGERWPNSMTTGKRGEAHSGYVNPDGSLRVQEKDGIPARNKRSVWTVTTKPYPGSHYAVFPPDLIEPCVLAGCPETVCAECGAPYERVVEETRTNYKSVNYQMDNGGAQTGGKGKNFPDTKTKTLGWQPTCDCDAGTKAGVVLDPFAGSGTTLMVARKHRRNAIGLDLNFEYLNINARERLQYGGYVPVKDGVTQLTIGASL